MQDTQSDIFEPAPAAAPDDSSPFLQLVLLGEDPLAPSARHDLTEIDVVRFGRGERGAARYCADGRRCLELTVPDRMMSTDHGSLMRAGERWLMYDPSSKNGVLVPGGRTRHATLAPGQPRRGDAFVLGGTGFLLGRQARPEGAIGGGPYVRLPDAPRDLAADQLAALLPGFSTFDPGLQASLATLARVAPTDVSVLICGATGTGKEVLARALHAASGRAGAFVAVNCGGLAASLVEAELFGHRRGAFSGAVADRLGYLRSAAGGTLFLDEIGELPLGAQAALLRALQEREVVPVGESLPLPVDFRLCAATHRDLRAMVATGSFREDLYARLMGMTVQLPPLAQRRADLGLLVSSLLARHGHLGARFSPTAVLALLDHSWPLNIRELERTLTLAATLAAEAPIALAQLSSLGLPAAAPLPPPDAASLAATARPASAPAAPPPWDTPSTPRPAPPLSDEDRARKRELEQLLDECDHNLATAARRLGKDRTQLYRWIRRFGIPRTGRSTGA
jgi:DNA-binding NtrC family response regulator